MFLNKGGTLFMVKIRLQRTGRHKLALYRIVVADARSPRDGRFLDIIGTYDPNTKPAGIKINNESLASWIKQGAQMTPTVKSILSGKDTK
jgi:small subunit ribosomal protein S16